MKYLGDSKKGEIRLSGENLGGLHVRDDVADESSFLKE